MSLKNRIKNILPDSALNAWRRAKKNAFEAYLNCLPRLTESDVRALLQEVMGIQPGDAVIVTSSIKALRLAFAPERLLEILEEIVGPSGTIAMHSFSQPPSREFLRSGRVFDVKNTPSSTGLLTELFRRRPGAVRSLHPIKAACAKGPLAAELTKDHHKSIRPFDATSPYYKLVEARAKSVGLGVDSDTMIVIHCVEDCLKEAFPVDLYEPEVFEAVCIDYEGRPVRVKTLAHSRTATLHDTPGFGRRYLNGVMKDFRYKLVPCFVADTQRVFEGMLACARRGITIYPQSCYKETFKNS
ncbi:MAG: AAC(3) family N-acetyltransferase [Elusimicrobia bacterium]|nr:AAC(3) family N-acetyltransferase [Elusimicrobiota bacterium]